MKRFNNLLFILLLTVFNIYGQADFPTNFQPAISKPLDNRQEIATLSDTSTIVFPHVNLKTWVVDIEQEWRYNGTSWEINTSGGIADGVVNGGTLGNNNILTLNRSQGGDVNINLSELNNNQKGVPDYVIRGIMNYYLGSIVLSDSRGGGNSNIDTFFNEQGVPLEGIEEVKIFNHITQEFEPLDASNNQNGNGQASFQWASKGQWLDTIFNGLSAYDLKGELSWTKVYRNGTGSTDWASGTDLERFAKASAINSINSLVAEGKTVRPFFIIVNGNGDDGTAPEILRDFYITRINEYRKLIPNAAFILITPTTELTANTAMYQVRDSISNVAVINTVGFSSYDGGVHLDSKGDSAVFAVINKILVNDSLEFTPVDKFLQVPEFKRSSIGNYVEIDTVAFNEGMLAATQLNTSVFNKSTTSGYEDYYVLEDANLYSAIDPFEGIPNSVRFRGSYNSLENEISGVFRTTEVSDSFEIYIKTKFNETLNRHDSYSIRIVGNTFQFLVKQNSSLANESIVQNSTPVVLTEMNLDSDFYFRIFTANKTIYLYGGSSKEDLYETELGLFNVSNSFVVNEGIIILQTDNNDVYFKDLIISTSKSIKTSGGGGNIINTIENYEILGKEILNNDSIVNVGTYKYILANVQAVSGYRGITLRTPSTDSTYRIAIHHNSAGSNIDLNISDEAGIQFYYTDDENILLDSIIVPNNEMIILTYFPNYNAWGCLRNQSSLLTLGEVMDNDPTATQILNMDNNRIANLADPTNSNNAVPLGFMEAYVASEKQTLSIVNNDLTISDGNTVTLPGGGGESGGVDSAFVANFDRHHIKLSNGEAFSIENATTDYERGVILKTAIAAASSDEQIYVPKASYKLPQSTGPIELNSGQRLIGESLRGTYIYADSCHLFQWGVGGSYRQSIENFTLETVRTGEGTPGQTDDSGEGIADDTNQWNIFNLTDLPEGTSRGSFQIKNIHIAECDNVVAYLGQGWQNVVITNLTATGANDIHSHLIHDSGNDNYVSVTTEQASVLLDSTSRDFTGYLDNLTPENLTITDQSIDKTSKVILTRELSILRDNINGISSVINDDFNPTELYYYSPFDKSSLIDDVVIDMSGNNNYGYHNNINTEDTEFGNMLNFDGVDDFIRTIYNPISTNQSIFVSMLIRTKQTSTNGDILRSDILQVEYKPTGVEFRCNTVGEGLLTRTSEIIDSSEWVHFAFSVSPDTIQLFQNGVLVGARSGATPLTNVSELIIGARNEGARFFEGNIGELIISSYYPGAEVDAYNAATRRINLTKNIFKNLAVVNNENLYDFYYPLVSEQISDWSLNNINNVITGSPVITEENMIFDGTNDRIEVDSFPSKNTTQYMFGAYVRSSGIGGNQRRIFSTSESELYSNEDGIELVIHYDNDTDLTLTYSSFNDNKVNQKVHVGYGRLNDTIYLLYNGFVVDQETLPGSNFDEEVGISVIGGSFIDANNRWLGTMSDVFMINTFNLDIYKKIYAKTVLNQTLLSLNYNKKDFNVNSITGNISANTDASGDVTVNHQLSDIPTYIQLTAQGIIPYVVQYHDLTSTTFKIRVVDMTGVPVVSTAVNITWTAEK